MGASRKVPRLRSRPYEGVYRATHDKGKPAARRGRKATDLPKEVAGLPEPKEHGQAWAQKEWEPGAALTGALEGLSLLPKSPDGDLAGLRPHLQEALGQLADLEWQRGLSGRERTREEALRMLLASVERAEQ